jgi:hypothetical protein
VGAVVATIGTAVAWSHNRGLRLAGGVLFVPWAIYWGLLKRVRVNAREGCGQLGVCR